MISTNRPTPSSPADPAIVTLAAEGESRSVEESLGKILSPLAAEMGIAEERQDGLGASDLLSRVYASLSKAYAEPPEGDETGKVSAVEDDEFVLTDSFLAPPPALAVTEAPVPEDGGVLARLYDKLAVVYAEDQTKPEEPEPDDTLELDGSFEIPMAPESTPSADLPEEWLETEAMREQEPESASDPLPEGESPPPSAALDDGALALVLSKLSTIYDPPEPEPEPVSGPEQQPETEESAEEDVLVLDASFQVVPEPEEQLDPEKDDSVLGKLYASLSAVYAEEQAKPSQPDEDDILILDESCMVSEARAEPPPFEPESAPEPQIEPEPQSETVPAPEPDSEALERLNARILQLAGDQPCDAALPEDTASLMTLLADPPPSQDFRALDLLFACWPRNTLKSKSRALLATALNLSRNFGLPGRVPMASTAAWRMLDPVLFQADLARRLEAIGAFVADWQKTQKSFLVLEFGEVEQVEYLFETLEAGTYHDLLAGVMNFKVMSNRRLGLIRRMPPRLRKRIAPMLADDRDRAMVEMAHVKALLERIADPSGFAPIVEAAERARDEVDKMMRQVAGAGNPALPPGTGPQALGRIG